MRSFDSSNTVYPINMGLSSVRFVFHILKTVKLGLIISKYRSNSLPSAFVVVGRFAPDEERLVLSKPVVQFSFTYNVSRGIFIFVKATDLLTTFDIFLSKRRPNVYFFSWIFDRLTEENII